MVKNGKTKPIDIRTKEKVLELEAKGYTRKHIQQVTGVSRASQKKFSKENSLGLPMQSKTSKKTMWNNPNSSVDNQLLNLVIHDLQPFLEVVSKEMKELFNTFD